MDFELSLICSDSKVDVLALKASLSLLIESLIPLELAVDVVDAVEDDTEDEELNGSSLLLP